MLRHVVGADQPVLVGRVTLLHTAAQPRGEGYDAEAVRKLNQRLEAVDRTALVCVAEAGLMVGLPADATAKAGMLASLPYQLKTHICRAWAAAGAYIE